MFPEVEKILIDRNRLADRVAQMGAQIVSDIHADIASAGGNPDEPDQIVLVPILTGAMIFVADLVRQMPLRLRLRVVAVSSYPGTSIASRGAMLASELPRDLGGKHVVVVDDILDSGQTLRLVNDLIEKQKPASIRHCVMLQKDLPIPPAIEADYVGFPIPDEFVVGYGLDYDGYYRNCPDIVTLAPERLHDAT